MNRRNFLATTGQGILLSSVPSRIWAGGSESGSKQTISVFSKHLQWLDYDGMAATAAEIGFDGIDLTVRPNGHVLPERVESDLPKAWEACRRAGITIAMITTAILDGSQPQSEAILRTAAGLGIPYYRTGWFDYDESITMPQNLENFTVRLRELATLNEKYQTGACKATRASN